MGLLDAIGRAYIRHINMVVTHYPVLPTNAASRAASPTSSARTDGPVGAAHSDNHLGNNPAECGPAGGAQDGFFRRHRLAIVVGVVIFIIVLVVLYVYLTRVGTSSAEPLATSTHQVPPLVAAGLLPPAPPAPPAPSGSALPAGVTGQKLKDIQAALAASKTAQKAPAHKALAQKASVTFADPVDDAAAPKPAHSASADPVASSSDLEALSTNMTSMLNEEIEAGEGYSSE